MKNKKLLMVGGQGLSHINRLLAISRYLPNFKIYIISEPGTLHNELVESNGLTPVTYPKYNQSWNSIELGFQEFYDFESMMQTYHPFDREFLNRSLKEESKLIDTLSPDLIISDSQLEFSLLAKIKEIPLISIFQEKFHPKMRLKWRKPLHTETTPLFLDYYNTYSRNQGFKNFGSLEGILSGDLSLIPSFPEYSGFKDDVNTTHIGPLLHRPESNNIFEEISGKKLYVYMGSYEKDPGLKIVFDSLKKDFEDQQEISIIFAYGNNKIKDSQSPPFFNFGYIPGFAAIRDCDLAIHHGGHSSCMNTISQAKSTIIVPTNAERDWNAQRLEKLGFGKRLLLEEVPYAIKEAVKKGLSFKPVELDLLNYLESQENKILKAIHSLL